MNRCKWRYGVLTLNGLRQVAYLDRQTLDQVMAATGVPLEPAPRVTGHQTAKVVLKPYFRPGREDFWAVRCGAMPRMLANEGSDP